MTSPSVAGPDPTVAALLAEMLPAVLARSGGMLSIKDADSGRYLHVSPAMAAWLGRDAADVVGRTDAELFAPAVATALRAAEQTALAHHEPLASDHRFEHAGARHDFQVVRLATAVGSGPPRWLAAVWLDQSAERQRETQMQTALAQIEQQQRANEQLRRQLADQALRDPTTGLYTRGHFEDQLRREVDLSTREHREFSLVYIALDPPNEKVRALGAAAHARVLEAMGRLLRSGTRAMDASCRHEEGGFAVLLSGVGLATAHSRMEGLRRQCASQIVVLDGQELGFTVSMGVASYPHTAHTQDELLAACAAALAEAQRRGGNQVTLAAIRFDPGQ